MSTWKECSILYKTSIKLYNEIQKRNNSVFCFHKKKITRVPSYDSWYDTPKEYEEVFLEWLINLDKKLMNLFLKEIKNVSVNIYTKTIKKIKLKK